MNRNIAKPFTATLSLLDVASDKTHKYKCFHGEDVQLTVKVVGEEQRPIDLSNTSVKIYFTLDKNVNEPVYRQDTGIMVDDLGVITVMLEKSYIRIGNNVLKIVLYDEDQTVFLQPLIITCIDPLIGEVPDLEIPDDIDVRDELYDIRRIIGDLQDFDDLARNEHRTVRERLDDFDSQLDDKTNMVETQLLQNQVNNLVLGATGDGNNAEVVASRGGFDLLPNRLDDFDIRTDTLINIRNVFDDKSIRSKSWGAVNGDYEITEGTNFSNAIKVVTGDSKISIYKDISISNIKSGKYVFSLKCMNRDDFNLFISFFVIGYPTSVNSGGTTLFSKSDIKVWDFTLNDGYQKNEFEFSINTNNYDHCRIILECENLNSTYNLTDLYLGIKNSICNEFSYIDYKINSINNKIDSINNTIVFKLHGKSLYLNGDSITFGAGYAGGYGKLLANKYGCINTNNAISGGTLASGTTYSNGSPRHYISESVVNSVNKRYDYMILSGGFNDYGNNVPIGTLSDAEFCFTNPVTTDNVIGALETMFRHILQNYPTTKVYFLITHKANRCTTQVNGIGKTMQDYVNAIKSVCERYSIPVINVWEESRMITAYNNIATTYTNDADRVHPNQLGYEEFYLPVIEKELGL